MARPGQRNSRDYAAFETEHGHDAVLAFELLVQVGWVGSPYQFWFAEPESQNVDVVDADVDEHASTHAGPLVLPRLRRPMRAGCGDLYPNDSSDDPLSDQSLGR